MMTDTQDYVVGVLFDDQDRVCLIRKERPEWQRGRLNGVGGKYENTDLGEKNAMSREFQEETGVWIEPSHWTAYAMRPYFDLNVSGCIWYFFAQTRAEVFYGLKTMTDEKVEILDVNNAMHDKDVLDDICSLIRFGKRHYEIVRLNDLS